MLAPRASGAFVCIRCELRLARPRPRIVPRRPLRSNFSASAGLRNADEDTAPAEETTPKPRLSEHPLGRLRKRKGNSAIRETIARLEGAKTLGDDARILVLQEVGERPAGENAVPEIISTATQDAPNIVESLQQEKRPLTPQEIVKQLESLRPKTHADPNEPNHVSQSKFVKLSKTLSQGFTVQQLSHYYSVTKGVKRKEVTKGVIDGLKQLQGKAERPAERSEWHPGTTLINLRLPSLDVHHRPKRKPISKHLLVDQILRDVWKLVLLEEIESPGELELSLKPWQLTLLSSGTTTTPLDRIGRERKAKLELYPPDNVLRITADKYTAEYAADDVEQLLQTVETKRFHLRPWLPYLETDSNAEVTSNIFPDKSLQVVSKMTGAVVQTENDHQVMIRALGKSAIKEAELCLIKLLPLKPRFTSTIDTTRRDQAKDHSYLRPVTVEQASLVFKARDQKLGRWVLPTPRRPMPKEVFKDEPASDSESNSAVISTEQSLDGVQAQVLEMIQSPTTPQDTPDNRQTGQWAVEPQVQLSAQFGQALFPVDPAQVDSASGAGIFTFLPAIPALAKLLTDNTFQVINRPSLPVLEYEFVAAPEQQNFKRGQEFPNLHVQFRHNPHTGKHSLRKLALGFHNRSHNILLPNKAVDIRINWHTQVHLQSAGADKKIANFIEAVVANVQSGEKLSAPNLDLDIPKWTIPNYVHADKEGTRTVKYLFTGVRFRQSVAGRFLDADVSYSTVQSGKLGRKGGSLSAYCNTLRSGKEKGESDVDAPKKLGDFLKSCFAIADRITQATANDQPLLKKTSKPRNEMSARKIRRQALQSTAGEEAVSDINEIASRAEVVEDRAGAANLTDTSAVSNELNAIAAEVNSLDMDNDFVQPVDQTDANTAVEEELDFSTESSAPWDVDNSTTPYPPIAFDNSSQEVRSADTFGRLDEDDETIEREHGRVLKTVA